MLISEEFPSKYLKSSDLKGREIKVTMSHVEREQMGQDRKTVLYFEGKEKGMVLNKTNAMVIGDFYGDDTDHWTGQPIILFSVMTEFQGKATPGLRCRIPTARDNKPQREDPITSGPQPAKAKELNDDIPF